MSTGVYERKKRVKYGMTGKKHSKETKEKMKGNTHGFQKGNTLRKGIKSPKKTKKKISKANKGIKNYFYGKHHTEETKKRIRRIKLGKKMLATTGEKHWTWNPDRCMEQNRRNDPAYKKWRLEVYKRDNYKCRINNKDCSSGIEAHHILSWSEFPELRYQVNNGITLCQAHHPRGRAKEKRLVPFLRGLVSVSSI